MACGDAVATVTRAAKPPQRLRFEPMDTPASTDLPTQPSGVPWPTDAWPTRPVPPAADASRLTELFDEAFESSPPELGLTQAVVVVHGGAVVAERYGEVFHSELDALSDKGPLVPGPDTTMLSWSMAKSILHAVIGPLVGLGTIDLDAPTPVPEWEDPTDGRNAITWRNLLTMTSGLAWAEDYVDGGASDVIEMLFGSGAPDMAAFAASKPLVAEPGRNYCYSSGTSNILARSVQRLLGLVSLMAYTTR